MLNIIIIVYLLLGLISVLFAFYVDYRDRKQKQNYYTNNLSFWGWFFMVILFILIWPFRIKYTIEYIKTYNIKLF